MGRYYWFQRRSKSSALAEEPEMDAPPEPQPAQGASAGMPLFMQRAAPSSEGLAASANASPRGRAGLSIQRAKNSGDAAPLPPQEAKSGAASFVVEDDVTPLAAGQMHKSDFLALLRGEVDAVAKDTLSGILYAAIFAPKIDQWFRTHEAQSAADLERSLRRYAPGSNDARACIAAVASRVGNGLRSWASRDEDASPHESTGLDLPDVPSGEADSGDDPIAFKAREEGTKPTAVHGVRAQLDQGRGLEGDTRARMEAAFGRDFSHVRIHDGARTEQLAGSMSARAFTVGNDVAFASGEYQPGTAIGDALLAHELAHVVQQDGATSASVSSNVKEGDALENEADESAMAAVVSLWGRGLGALGDMRRNASPALRSGLRLSRCSKSAKQRELERLGALQYQFLKDKAKKEEDDQRKAAEEAAKKANLPPPKATPKVEVEDVLQAEVKKGGFGGNSTDPWTTLSPADQASWKTRAATAWAKVVASVAGTELEAPMKGKSFAFVPEVALEKGWYAWQSGDSYSFGMGWVKDVEADPKNAWPNVAHEMGGHREYGDTYASGIWNATLDQMPSADAAKWRNDPALRERAFETYQYPETEIYAALRERRYSNPEVGPAPTYGGLRPDVNIPSSLAKIKAGLEPEAAKAVLLQLKAKIDASPEILARDKAYFVAQVSAVFGYSI